VATVAAIELAGANPVLADIEPETFLLDPRDVSQKITKYTKAVIPVHLFGQPASLDCLGQVCQSHGIYLIEDCAQAHGALFGSRRVGAWGHIGCFSFYPTKNLGALGDGGMVATNDQSVALRIRELREYGWRSRFVSDTAGCNSRLDELQAAILRVKLRYLAGDNQRRQQIAAKYNSELADGILKPVIRDDRSSVFHQYVVRVSQRGYVQQSLSENGVGTAIHYPVPIHLQPAYRGHLGDVGSFPRAEAAAHEVLSLPVYPELSDLQVERIVSVLNQHHILAVAARA
jgi:dTDP-4-amino-4,6-dideoxygalactose transaminase